MAVMAGVVKDAMGPRWGMCSMYPSAGFPHSTNLETWVAQWDTRTEAETDDWTAP